MEDFIPYGFIEMWVAEYLDLDNYEFPLSAGSLASVNEYDFREVTRVLSYDETAVVNSSFQGAFVAIHSNYADWSMLESVTDGDVKGLDVYIRCEERNINFNLSDCKEMLYNNFVHRVTTQDRERIDVDITVAPVAAPEYVDVTVNVSNSSVDDAVADSNGGDAFSQLEYADAVRSMVRHFVDNNSFEILPSGRFVMFPESYNLKSIEAIKDLSFTLDADIVVGNRNVNHGIRISDNAYFVDYNSSRITGSNILNTPYNDLHNVHTNMGSGSHVYKDIILIANDLVHNADDFTYHTLTIYCYESDFDIPKYTKMLIDEINGDLELDINIPSSIANKIGGYHGVKSASSVNMNGVTCDDLDIMADELGVDLITFGLDKGDYDAITSITKDINILKITNASNTHRIIRSNGGGICLGLHTNDIYSFSVESIQSFDVVLRDTVSNVVIGGIKSGNIFLININNNTLKAVSFRISSNKTYEEIHENDLLLYASNIEESRDSYVKTYSESITKVITEKKNSLENRVQSYSELSDRIMKLSREIRDLNIELSMMDEDKLRQDSRDHALNDYNEILDIDLVNNIFVKDDYLSVYTNNIYVKHDVTGKYYDIGTFHIRVYVGSDSYSSDYTRIYNTKHTANAYEHGMNAPHVFSAGNLCHGNLTTGLSNSYRSKDMFGVVYQIILFLSSANIDDVAGAKVTSWPEVTEEEVLSASPDSIYGSKEVCEFEGDLMSALSVI